MKIELSDQVYQFVRRQAPVPRRQLRAALRRLADEQGDIQPLEGDLAGFYRLRVGRYRVVFHYLGRGGERLIRCEFAEERSLVYEVFAVVARHLGGTPKR